MPHAIEETRNDWAVLLILSLIGGLVFALSFVAVVAVIAGGSVDSFAIGIAIGIAMGVGMIAGIVVFPLYHMALSRRSLRVCVPIVWGAVLVEIVIVTPLHPGFGFLGSFGALVVALVACRLFVPARVCPSVWRCENCHYDLRGHQVTDRTCPECGSPRALGSVDLEQVEFKLTSCLAEFDTLLDESPAATPQLELGRDMARFMINALGRRDSPHIACRARRVSRAIRSGKGGPYYDLQRLVKQAELLSNPRS